MVKDKVRWKQMIRCDDPCREQLVEEELQQSVHCWQVGQMREIQQH